ncbi:MAG: aminotransferase class I/II-fold pyridoxal phosphate-dependent enzyme [Acidobacteria bacterium]|nr:MAG: aminotransferase class I/II-fold pyridoxal phosphate-dependent enzyme [Acidobacteriota bacterium]
MRIPIFEMERMQSTWENLVEYDMSESGVRPVTLRELHSMGLDLDAALDMPLGYSQSDGTPGLKELLSAIYPGATQAHIEVTNGTSEANFLVALTLLDPGSRFVFELPNYMQLHGVARGVGARVGTFRLRQDAGWEPDWEEFDRAVIDGTRLVYVSNPNNPTGGVLSDQAMRRIVDRCEKIGAYLISDEVYQGAEVSRPLTKSFWGMSDHVIVTSGLSKAYGIPGVRIGWIIGPPDVVETCWSQHDYLTIGPNKLSDMIARTAVAPANREKLYLRTREILKANLPVASAWVDSFGGFLSFRPPEAGAIAFVKYESPASSLEIAETIRTRQSTLIVPGSHFGMEGYIRLWLGGRPEFLSEGLRHVGIELCAFSAQGAS